MLCLLFYVAQTSGANAGPEPSPRYQGIIARRWRHKPWAIPLSTGSSAWSWQLQPPSLAKDWLCWDGSKPSQNIWGGGAAASSSGPTVGAAEPTERCLLLWHVLDICTTLYHVQAATCPPIKVLSCLCSWHAGRREWQWQSSCFLPSVSKWSRLD